MSKKEHPAAALIAKHAWKPRSVEVDDVSYEATFFDWYALEAEDEVAIDKGKELPEDKRDDYFNHVTLWLSDFDEYFAGEHTETIDGGTWLPIAVLGMGSKPESFAEMNNDGFLALVLEGEGKGSVIRYNQDDFEMQTVAASLADLEIEETGTGDGDSDDTETN